jgi:hypothetical protein
MPVFFMDQREWVELTTDQVDLARMALDDFRALADPSSAAIQLLRKEFPFTLKHAVCAVAYAKQHPVLTPRST